MKEQSESFKVISERVLGLGRVHQVCKSKNVNDVQGFGWHEMPKFNANGGDGFWWNTRVKVTHRANPNRSEWD